jgi:hypothetical protein
MDIILEKKYDNNNSKNNTYIRYKKINTNISITIASFKSYECME